MSKEHLTRAILTKNDEFYTSYDTVKNQMKDYNVFLKDKTIYCNCDLWNLYDTNEPSNYIKYFVDHFFFIGLKKLIATGYRKEGQGEWFVYDGQNIQKGYLSGDGSFDGDEVRPFLMECDVIITNPPFSLMRHYF